MDEQKIREAIEEFEIEVQVFEDMISYCKHFEPKNDCGRYEKKIAMYKTAIEALEEQLPMIPTEEGNYFLVYKCPKCEKVLAIGVPYCPYCGQKLDWRE